MREAVAWILGVLLVFGLICLAWAIVEDIVYRRRRGRHRAGRAAPVESLPPLPRRRMPDAVVNAHFVALVNTDLSDVAQSMRLLVTETEETQ